MLNNKMKLNIQLFATTLCTIAQTSGPSHNRAIIQVVVSEELVSAENKSKITAKVQLKKKNTSTTACTFNATISIDGQSGTCSKYRSNWNDDSWQDIGSVTKTVEHNQDGSKFITINTTVKTEDDATSLTGTYKANRSNIELTKINRASDLNLIDDFQLDNTITVTINRYIDSAKHTLAVKSGSTTIKTYNEGNNNWASSGINVSFTSSEKTTIQNLMTSPQIELTFILTTTDSGTTIGSSTQKAMVSSLSKPIYRNIIKKQNGHYRVSINGAIDNTTSQPVQIFDDNGDDVFYYKSGDIVEFGNTSGHAIFTQNGYITSSTTQVYLTFILPKRLDNITTITVKSFNVEARGIKSGYLNSTSGYIEYVGKSGYTFDVQKVVGRNDAITVTLQKSSAWTNVDNNTPVVMNGHFKFELI